MKSEIKFTLCVYNLSGLEPKVSTYSFSSPLEFLSEAPRIVIESAKEKNSPIPDEVIRELVQNLIHADFKDCVVSILDEGKTIRVSDRGKGIKDKENAVEPGFTSISGDILDFIRGVGAGLYIAREHLKRINGTLTIQDNLDGGCVVTASVLQKTPSEEREVDILDEDIYLTDRQKKILLCFSDIGKAGPTQISKEVNIPIATAYREISFLEKKGLVVAVSYGKRHLTQKGIKYLQR